MPKLCCAVKAGGVTWPSTRGCSQQGKVTYSNATTAKPPALQQHLKLLSGPLRARAAGVNPETTPAEGWALSTSPSADVPGTAVVCPKKVVWYLRAHRPLHTTCPLHHATIWTNTTTNLLNTASIYFLLTRGKKCPNIFYITNKLKKCFMFSIYFQFTAMVSILIAMYIL